MARRFDQIRRSLWEELRAREDAALIAAREELPRVEMALKQVERDLDNSRSRLHASSQELLKIRQSRLWKTASIYWAVRRRLKRLASLFERAGAPSPPPLAGRAEQVSAAAPNRHDVVCFPIIDWDFRFQRPQQLAVQLAKAGHRVFYTMTALQRETEGILLRRIILPNVAEIALPVASAATTASE